MTRKEGQIKHKSSRREKTKITAEFNEVENNKIRKVNEIESLFFQMVNKLIAV